MPAKLGEVLECYRQMNRLRQRDLADELGLPISTICRIENGKSCDQDTTIKLINWLFSRDG